jgi:hypothetical protein
MIHLSNIYSFSSEAWIICTVALDLANFCNRARLIFFRKLRKKRVKYYKSRWDVEWQDLLLLFFSMIILPQIGCSKATFVYVDERGLQAKSCVMQYAGYLWNLKGFLMRRDQQLRVPARNFVIQRHQQLPLRTWNSVILMDQNVNVSFRMQNKYPKTWVATNSSIQDSHSQFSTMISVREVINTNIPIPQSHERRTYNCGLDRVRSPETKALTRYMGGRIVIQASTFRSSEC